ncbi:MAG: toll/interleukin-1 receptor domain-containing protein, partial [Pseudomonadota bacterium]
IFVSHASADNHRLRDTIHRLVDAGVRLWFDRPYEIDIPDDKLAGFIPDGQSWSRTLLRAVANANGLLFFPSQAFSDSKECHTELVMAALLSEFSEGRFPAIPIFCAEDDTAKLDARFDQNQGYMLPWDIDASNTAALEKKEKTLDRLASRLIEATETPLNIADKFGTVVEAHIDNELDLDEATGRTLTDFHYRIDRTDQRNSARRVHVADAAADKQPLLVCHGPAEECVSAFVQISLATRLLPELERHAPEKFKWAHESLDVLRPVWREADTDFDFRLSIFNAFQAASGQRDGRADNSAEGLASAFSSNDVTRIVSLPEYGVTDPDALRKRIESWAAFWDAFPFDRSRGRVANTILPILEVSYSDTPTGGGWFSRKRPASEIVSAALEAEDLPLQVNGGLSHTRIVVLKALPQVSKSCVDEWIAEDTPFRSLAVSTRDKIRRNLKTVFDAGETLSMEDWADRAPAALQDSGLFSTG